MKNFLLFVLAVCVVLAIGVPVVAAITGITVSVALESVLVNVITYGAILAIVLGVPALVCKLFKVKKDYLVFPIWSILLSVSVVLAIAGSVTVQTLGYTVLIGLIVGLASYEMYRWYVGGRHTLLYGLVIGSQKTAS